MAFIRKLRQRNRANRLSWAICKKCAIAGYPSSFCVVYAIAASHQPYCAIKACAIAGFSFSISDLLPSAFSSQVGAGILGLPFAFRQVGAAPASTILIVVAVLCTHCMLQVVRCKRVITEELGKPVSQLGDIGFWAFGRSGALLVDASMIISQTGFSAAYLIFIGANVNSMFPSAPRVAVILLCLPGLFAMAMVRNLKRLAPFSAFANAANLTGLAVVLHVAIAIAVYAIIGRRCQVSRFSFALAAFIFAGSATSARWRRPTRTRPSCSR